MSNPSNPSNPNTLLQQLQDTTRNIVYNQSTNKQTLLVDTSTVLQLQIGSLTASNCNVNIGNSQINLQLNYVASFDDTSFSNLQNQVSTVINNHINATPLLKLQLDPNSDVEGISNINSVSKTIANNLSQTAINEQLASFNVNILRNINIQNIECVGSTITIGNANIMLDLQVNFVATIIMNSIQDNPLYKTLSQQNLQSSTTLPSTNYRLGIIIGVFIFSLLILFFICKKFCSRKVSIGLVSSLVIFFVVYVVLAYKYKWFPWYNKYSVVLDSNGFRLNQCTLDNTNGVFSSLNECTQSINDPNSVWYYQKFWGFDPTTNKCNRYPQIVNGDITATYSNETDCNSSNSTTYWTPNYLTSQPINTNISNPSGACSENVYSYYDPTSCKQQMFTGNSGTLPTLSFKSETDCINAVKTSNQTPYYFVNCNGTNPSNVCQFYKTTINGDGLQYTSGQTTPFVSPSKDNCTVNVQ